MMPYNCKFAETQMTLEMTTQDDKTQMTIVHNYYLSSGCNLMTSSNVYNMIM
jgi:hypothetical protein